MSLGGLAANTNGPSKKFMRTESTDEQIYSGLII